MSWVESESNRANRNLLLTSVIFGAVSAVGLVDIVGLTKDQWKESGANGMWVPLILLAAVLCLALWGIVKALNRYRDVEKSPIWKCLAAYGQPPQLSSEIEQDLLAPPVKYKRIRLTQNWLLQRQFFSSYVSPIADIAWVYELVTRRRVNGIPTGKTYSAVIYGKHKQKHTFQASRKKVDAFIAELNRRAPWAIFGFNEELRTTWNKNHPAFVAAVDERRHKLGLK